MKSVTHVYAKKVHKYGMGPIAVDVAYEGTVLRDVGARCPAGAVPQVQRLEWITFADTASSMQLQEALRDAGVQRRDSAGFCVGFEVDSANLSLDDVVVCEASRRSIRTLFGMTVPAGPQPDLKPGCPCTSCKHGLSFVTAAAGDQWGAFTSPGPCRVAECRNMDGSKLLTMVLPEDHDVCGVMLVMSRVPGTTVAKAVRANPDRAPEVCESVFSALSQLHSGSVVHNDCKLDNFVIELDTMITRCIDFEMAVTPALSAQHLLGTVGTAAGIDLEWSTDGQKCDVTQACVAFHEMCGSYTPGFCSSIATFAKPFQIEGHLSTPIYFTRCAKAGFVTASVAATAVSLEDKHGKHPGGTSLWAQR